MPKFSDNELLKNIFLVENFFRSALVKQKIRQNSVAERFGFAAAYPWFLPMASNTEVRNRVTLCRCGQSRNKPFCGGMHAQVKFRDEEIKMTPKL